MAFVEIGDLRDELPFGARVSGVTLENLKDEANRRRIWNSFEARGLLVQ